MSAPDDVNDNLALWSSVERTDPAHLTLTLVEAREVDGPADGQALVWRLLTTRTVTEAADAITKAGLRAQNGLSKDEVDLMMESIKKGMKPATAARIVGGNAQKTSSLMTYYMKVK